MTQQGQRSHVIILMSSFSKYCFQNVSCPHKNENPAFSNSIGLKNAFESSVFVTDFCGRDDCPNRRRKTAFSIFSFQLMSYFTLRNSQNL